MCPFIACLSSGSQDKELQPACNHQQLPSSGTEVGKLQPLSHPQAISNSMGISHPCQLLFKILCWDAATPVRVSIVHGYLSTTKWQHWVVVTKTALQSLKYMLSGPLQKRFAHLYLESLILKSQWNLTVDTVGLNFGASSSVGVCGPSPGDTWSSAVHRTVGKTVTSYLWVQQSGSKVAEPPVFSVNAVTPHYGDPEHTDILDTIFKRRGVQEPQNRGPDWRLFWWEKHLCVFMLVFFIVIRLLTLLGKSCLTINFYVCSSLLKVNKVITGNHRTLY